MGTDNATDNAANSPIPPDSENGQYRPELDIWDPPFERWLRLADELLRDYPIPERCISSPQTRA
jgi:hypothetical protein